jgi:predicted ATPase
MAGGNPLFLRELVDALVREQSVQVEGVVAEVVDPDASSSPPSLAAAIFDRLGFLSEPSVHVLRVAALLGGKFSVDDLVVVMGSPPPS